MDIGLLSFYHSDVVEHFVDNKTVYGSGALHFAAKDGDYAKVRKILSVGANVNEQNVRGESPLHWACHSTFDCDKIILLLLSKGAYIETSDQDGNTPLHWACEVGNIVAVKILCNAGAIVDYENNDFEVPIEFAVMSGSKETVKYLKELSDERDEDILILACECDQSKIVKLLLRNCSVSLHGLFLALHVAKSKNESECAKILSSHIIESNSS